jgi:osmotically-inducible protein OsmY
MYDRDVELTRRIRDIVAVVTEDMDAVTWEVEDGVAYVEGVVGSEDERRALCRAVRQLDGLSHVVTCLATERVMPSQPDSTTALYPPTVMMHYHSLS